MIICVSFLFHLLLIFSSLFHSSLSSSSLIDQHSFIFKFRQQQQQQLQQQEYPKEEPNYSEYLLFGIQAIHEKNVFLAHQYFDEILARHPTHADTLFNKGVAYQANGDALNAIITYTKALESNPNDLRILLNLAAMNQLRNNLTEAIEHYRVGLEISKANNLDIRLKFQGNLGSAYYQAGHVHEALRTFEDLLNSLQQTLLSSCSQSLQSSQKNVSPADLTFRFLQIISSPSRSTINQKENPQKCQEFQFNFENGLNAYLNAQRSVAILQDQVGPDLHRKSLVSPFS
jgi:tetratricopeptide (TPR) repeat protein